MKDIIEIAPNAFYYLNIGNNHMSKIQPNFAKFIYSSEKIYGLIRKVSK